MIHTLSVLQKTRWLLKQLEEVIFITQFDVFRWKKIMHKQIVFRLVVSLLAAKKQHDVELTSCSEIQNMTRNIKMKQQVDRSTKVLLSVLALSVIVEVPSGVVGLMTIIYNNGIHNECYHTIVLILDTMTLINTSITFVIYYSTSHNFKATFKSLFHRST